MQKITDTMVLFWQNDTVFSNWVQPSCFYIEKNLFKNSEAAFMYYKAVFFGDEDTAAKILNSSQDPKFVKTMGRQIKNFDEAAWVSAREQVMYEVCLQKFLQIEEFKQQMLSTGDRELVEASPYDKIWGIGLAPDDEKALDRKNWKGLNLLGKVLMRIRDTIRGLDD